MKIKFCPCGSGRLFSKCCEPYFSILGLKFDRPNSRTILFEWLHAYSAPIAASFMRKANTYIFRISWYLDRIIDQFFPLGFERACSNKEAANKVVFSIKNNIRQSLLASFSCLSQGLFLQSGILLRSLTEDCFVLLDLFENKEQLERFLQGKYSTSGLVSRVKKIIPSNVVSWYGYFSANFTHFGPLHPAPYLPTACYADNYVLVVGLQNIVRAIATFHLVLERMYFDKTDQPLLWRRTEGETSLVFNEDSPVFIWAEEIDKEIAIRYPPDERKNGFFYDSQSYQTK
ncbi:SEC-C metal-binding domain-containing protein [Chloroflexota bacterium]